MNRHRNNNMGAAMLQPGRKASQVAVLPAVEMPMVLTLDQLGPNPDNPRTTRNPQYEEIKASISARGLDTVPKVTCDPDGEPDKYIFSDGGNTRYQILSELWQETKDERFYRIHVLFKPWPGRLQCLIGHLAENEVRGELSFIEKAKGIHKARTIYEEQLGKRVSLRELSAFLSNAGLPVHNSTISRMEDALAHLYPWMPDLLESGLGAPQIRVLLALRQDAEKVWGKFSFQLTDGKNDFSTVFGTCCSKFNAPELWSLDMFRDELIGDLLQALPHPELNYDRWLFELDPKHKGVLSTASVLPNTDEETSRVTAPSDTTEAAFPVVLSSRQVEKQPSPSPKNAPVAVEEPREEEARHDEYCAVILNPERRSMDVADDDEDLMSMLSPALEPEEEEYSPLPVDAIWPISLYQDDIEHLQNLAFVSAWELAEQLGCEAEILPDRTHTHSPGYRGAAAQCSSSAALLLSLAGCCPVSCPPIGLDAMLIGGSAEQDSPVLDDTHAIKLLRLMRIMRRLRELQRCVVILEEGEPDEDE
ncbi:ParB family protein [Serratia microhaemolytica]|uniref:ParB family protein n=1 Tax=Serratia microhaemolytica TaxID=2675110 RepID=UPI000FDEBBB6|nr:ParB family protein [Serratia microhaemolytica]